MTIKGLRFERTCGACPEQYDVFNENGKQVGYVRLRWGGLSATCPLTDNQVYHHSFDDGWMGMFKSPEQREFHLNKIAEALIQEIGDFHKKFQKTLDILIYFGYILFIKREQRN